ncbi:MAG: GlsB/YeaQ/YmgE family stress response membrane protein [Chloroflexi bacterium]|nr:GlsB/YeaQ/YmgE family stress response membrane protein [Chloroflexota bacterium]
MFFLADTITSKPVTLNTTVGQIIAWIVIGLISGLLASFFMRGRKNLSTVVLIGLAGALVGGFVFDILNIQITGSLNNGFVIRWIDILVAFIGSILILLVTSRLSFRT